MLPHGRRRCLLRIRKPRVRRAFQKWAVPGLNWLPPACRIAASVRARSRPFAESADLQAYLETAPNASEPERTIILAILATLPPFEYSLGVAIAWQIEVTLSTGETRELDEMFPSELDAHRALVHFVDRGPIGSCRWHKTSEGSYVAQAQVVEAKLIQVVPA